MERDRHGLRIPGMETRGVSTVVIIPPLLQHLQIESSNDAIAELELRLAFFLTQLRIHHVSQLVLEGCN
jgi:hypothetical protein